MTRLSQFIMSWLLGSLTPCINAKISFIGLVHFNFMTVPFYFGKGIDYYDQIIF